MRSIRHHPGNSCYDLSVFVSYVAFGWPAVEAGLQDRRTGGAAPRPVLYDPSQPGSHRATSALPSPRAALSQRLGPGAGSRTPRSENIIISHMWPWTGKGRGTGIPLCQPVRQGPAPRWRWWVCTDICARRRRKAAAAA